MAKRKLDIEEQVRDRSRRFARPSEMLQMLLPLLMIGAALWVHAALPNARECLTDYYPKLLVVCAIVYAAFLLAAVCLREVRMKMLHLSWYLAMLAFLIGCYDVATLKTDTLTSMLTVDPETIVASVPNNFDVVLTNALGSLSLLAEGLAWGVASGVASGVLMGWSYYGNYWISPLLKVIGPVPSAVWLPISMALLPSAHAASIFIISLAVWFPLTLNIGSAMRNTSKGLIEAARCLGANSRDVLLRVALPAAMPAFFTGLFMGLSASFGALVFAEMLGVEAGLGWYIMASKHVFSFGRVLSSVIVFICVFSLLTAVLFKIRDRVLKWQKGYIHW